MTHYRIKLFFSQASLLQFSAMHVTKIYCNYMAH